MLDKNDMKMLREMMEATVKETVEATVQKAIEPLQQDICDLKEEVNGVKLHLENVTDRNISILAENHGYLVKKFNEAVEAAHEDHQQYEGNYTSGETSLDRGSTEARAYGLFLYDLSGGRHLTTLEHVGEVARVVSGEVTRDL